MSSRALQAKAARKARWLEAQAKLLRARARGVVDKAAAATCPYGVGEFLEIRGRAGRDVEYGWVAKITGLLVQGADDIRWAVWFQPADRSGVRLGGGFLPDHANRFCESLRESRSQGVVVTKQQPRKVA